MRDDLEDFGLRTLVRVLIVIAVVADLPPLYFEYRARVMERKLRRDQSEFYMSDHKP